MLIFIPTSHRGPHRQVTYDKIYHAVKDHYEVTLVCPPAELDGLQASGYNSIAGPAEPGIWLTRQYIMHLDTQEHNSIALVDDDLNGWSYRPDIRVGKYLQSTDREILRAFQWLADALTTHAHAAIGARLFANAKPAVELNTRMMRCIGYRNDIFRENQCEFFPVIDDLEMTVQLMTKGYSGIVTHEYVQDQPASNAPGGCSTYRTMQAQHDAAVAFNAKYPNYTRLTTKTTEGGWFEGQPRTDIAISWKKLEKDYKPSQI